MNHGMCAYIGWSSWSRSVILPPLALSLLLRHLLQGEERVLVSWDGLEPAGAGRGADGDFPVVYSVSPRGEPQRGLAARAVSKDSLVEAEQVQGSVVFSVRSLLHLLPFCAAAPPPRAAAVKFLLLSFACQTPSLIGTVHVQIRVSGQRSAGVTHLPSPASNAVRSLSFHPIYASCDCWLLCEGTGVQPLCERHRGPAFYRTAASLTTNTLCRRRRFFRDQVKYVGGREAKI